MVRVPGGDGWGAVNDFQADGGGCSPDMLSNGSGREGIDRHDTQSLRQRLSDGGEWTDDLEDGKRMSNDTMEATELAARQQRSFFTCWGIAPVAFVCLLLVRPVVFLVQFGDILSPIEFDNGDRVAKPTSQCKASLTVRGRRSGEPRARLGMFNGTHLAYDVLRLLMSCCNRLRHIWN